MRSPCEHTLSGRISKRDVVELKERSFLSKTLFILWQPCSLYLGLRSGKKINLRLREREVKLLGRVVTSNSKHCSYQKHTVLDEEQAEKGIACGFFFLRKVMLLLISHLQGEGEWKMTSRNGKRSIWSSLSVAQGVTEHAVLWDLLPASGTSLCATFGT